MTQAIGTRLWRRQQIVLGTALVALAALAWFYTARLAADMQGPADMPGMDTGTAMSMPSVQTWSLTDLAFLNLMWGVMMVAMMLPSATPMILTFAGMQRRRRERQQGFVPTSAFLAGYLAVWFGYSVLVASLQWGLHRASLLSPTMVSASPLLGGGLLVAAGIFQWTPLKDACLSSCRSPLSFLTMRWREGTGGALRMGVEHGALCVGCCWLLMALLFVAGVMNLLWVAALAGLVFVEKLAPGGRWISRAVGVLLGAWGCVLLTGAVR